MLPLTIFPKFDHVVMNPPFTLGRDIAHVTHAMDFLRPRGTLVAIMGSGIQWKQSRAHKAFRAMLGKFDAEVYPLPEKAFRQSGTDVRTVLVRVTTPR